MTKLIFFVTISQYNYFYATKIYKRIEELINKAEIPIDNFLLKVGYIYIYIYIIEKRELE